MIFSLTFYPTAVDLLDLLTASAHKVASLEAVDLQFICCVASISKPKMISSGLENAEKTPAACGGSSRELTVLHFISGFTAPVEEYNLRTISVIIERFGLVVQSSGNRLDNTTARGASVIEKHLTPKQNGGRSDDSLSPELGDVDVWYSDADTGWAALGKVTYAKFSETGCLRLRRLLHFVKDRVVGESIRAKMNRSVRSGCGPVPNCFDVFISRTVKAGFQDNSVDISNLLR